MGFMLDYFVSTVWRLDSALNGVFSFLLLILILLCGDVHCNPGPPRKLSNILSICHRNICSINCINKMDHVKADLCTQFDVITLSETWLKPSISNNIF